MDKAFMQSFREFRKMTVFKPWRNMGLFMALVLAVAIGGPPAYDVIAQDSVPKCNAKNEQRGPQNDSLWDWDEGNLDIPCYSEIYTIYGTVQAAPQSNVTQESPGSASGSGMMFGGYGSVGWSSTGAVFGEKGLVRLLVTDAPYELQSMATTGKIAILKFSDRKAMALMPGDNIIVKCRKEYEAVAPIANFEKFTEQTMIDASTYELDYCRLVTPVV